MSVEDLRPTKNQPFERIEKITQSDTVTLTDVRGLLVGVAAIVNINDLAANTVAPFLAAGIWHPVRVTKVFTTGTDSVGIWAGY